MPVISLMILLSLTACRLMFWEPLAPQRPFTVQDLLMDKEIVPLGWELSDPVFPLAILYAQQSVIAGGSEQGQRRLDKVWGTYCLPLPQCRHRTAHVRPCILGYEPIP